MSPDTALILVDVQHDFLPGGALAVTQGDEILPIIASLQPQFEHIVATQDWHPANHGSFAANHPGTQPGQQIELEGLPQILWPVHCVEGTFGADFPVTLDRSRWQAVFQKEEIHSLIRILVFLTMPGEGIRDLGVTCYCRELPGSVLLALP